MMSLVKMFNVNIPSLTSFTDHLKLAHDGKATIQTELDGSGIDVHQPAQGTLGRYGVLDPKSRCFEC
jgi:hypothetical protein